VLDASYVEVRELCLAVPAQISQITGTMATVDLGGVRREVSVVMVPGAKTGDYVLVHAGYAIQLVDQEEALVTLELFREIAEA
jgi:hydrogenase expression/formation protein HypC